MHKVPLGTVCSVKSGFAFKSKDWRDSGIPVIKIANVKNGFIDLDGCSFVDKQTAASAAAYELRPGDILISMTGYVGEIARVRSEGRMLLNQRVGKFSINDPSKLDGDFLFHCLRSPILKANFVSHAHGAAQPNISPALIEQQQIPLPVISEQIRIASILGAYDDLIEVNRRRVAVLEEMARGLFEEWFIRFRFPGQETVPIIDTPDGPLPEGWVRRSIGDVCSLVRAGGTPSRKVPEYWNDGELDWYTTSELNDGFLFSSKEKISRTALEQGSGRKFPAGTVFLALYGATIGKLGVALGDCSSNQAALGLIPDGIQMRRWQLFHSLYFLREWFISIGQGAAQQNISKEKVVAAPILVAPPELVDQFDRLVGPMWELRSVVEQQILNLCASRDLLLPRLISGELSVASVERELEEVA